MSKPWQSPMDAALGRDPSGEGQVRPTWFPTPPSGGSGPDGKGAVTIGRYPHKEIRITPEHFMGSLIFTWRIVLVLSSAGDCDTLAGGTSYHSLDAAFQSALRDWENC